MSVSIPSVRNGWFTTDGSQRMAHDGLVHDGLVHDGLAPNTSSVFTDPFPHHGKRCLASNPSKAINRTRLSLSTMSDHILLWSAKLYRQYRTFLFWQCYIDQVTGLLRDAGEDIMPRLFQSLWKAGAGFQAQQVSSPDTGERLLQDFQVATGQCTLQDFPVACNRLHPLGLL